VRGSGGYREFFSDKQSWVQFVSVLAAIVTIATFVLFIGDGEDAADGKGQDTASATTPPVASDDPASNECTTDERFERQARIQAGTESAAGPELDYGTVAGYAVGSHAGNQLSIELGGRLRGSDPEGYTLMLLATPDAHPDQDPRGQLPGDGRYYIADPNLFASVESGCWSYSRSRVGDGWCGQTTIFTIALVADTAVGPLEEERSRAPNNLGPERMTPPDVLKLATFEVPSVDGCPAVAG
jgi:hypothetical protein